MPQITKIIALRLVILEVITGLHLSNVTSMIFLSVISFD